MRCHKWEKIFAKYLSRTGLLSKIHEKRKKLNKKLNNLNKNGPKPLADTSPQKIYRRQINIGMILHSTCCHGNANSISNLIPAHACENDWRSTTWEYPVLGGRSRGMSPVTALLRAACVSPGSLHGHCWPETLHQHCPSPDRSQWLPDLPHLGLYLPTLLLVTTSGHGVFSLSLTFCPPWRVTSYRWLPTMRGGNTASSQFCCRCLFVIVAHMKTMSDIRNIPKDLTWKFTAAWIIVSKKCASTDERINKTGSIHDGLFSPRMEQSLRNALKMSCWVQAARN